MRTALTTLLLTLLCCAAASAETFEPASDAELQAALDDAVQGDEIVLGSNLVFTGPFVLRNRPAGAGEIVLRWSEAGNLPEGRRISPEIATSMPKIVTPGLFPALTVEAGAHDYRIIGIEFKAAAFAPNVISLNPIAGEWTSAAQLPRNIVFDRCYVHGDPSAGSGRGIAMNGADIQVLNSHFSDFKHARIETAAIGAWGGPGPLVIKNNHLEAAGINILIGGRDPGIPNLTPSDIEIVGNHLYKQPSWRPSPGQSPRWAVKNLLELKSARRVRIHGNTMENIWAGCCGQKGFAIVITPRNQDKGAPWTAVEDVEISSNIIRNAARGFNIAGYDDLHPSRQTKRINIHDNMIYNLGGDWGDGWFLQMLDGTLDVTIERNTVLGSGPDSRILYAGRHGKNRKHAGFVFRGNIVTHGWLGLSGDGTLGEDTLLTYFNRPVMKENVIIGASGRQQSRLPRGQHFAPNIDSVGFVDAANFDFRLRSTSPYKNVIE